MVDEPPSIENCMRRNGKLLGRRFKEATKLSETQSIRATCNLQVKPVPHEGLLEYSEIQIDGRDGDIANCVSVVEKRRRGCSQPGIVRSIENARFRSQPAVLVPIPRWQPIKRPKFGCISSTRR